MKWGLRNDANFLDIEHWISFLKPSPCDSQPYPVQRWDVSVFQAFRALTTWESSWMWIWGSRDVLRGEPRSASFRVVHLKSYFKQNVTTLCGSVCTCTPLCVELFICLLYFLAHLSRGNTRRQAKGEKKSKGMKVWKVRIWLGCGKQSLTWHYFGGELQLASNFSW